MATSVIGGADPNASVVGGADPNISNGEGLDPNITHVGGCLPHRIRVVGGGDGAGAAAVQRNTRMCMQLCP